MGAELNQLKATLAAQEANCHTATQRLGRLIAEIESERQGWTQTSATRDLQRVELEKLSQDKQNLIVDLRDQLHDAQQALDALQDQYETKVTNANQSHSRLQNALDNHKKTSQQTITNLRQSLTDLQETSRQADNKASCLVSAQAALNQKWKTESTQALANFQRTLHTLKAANSQLTQDNMKHITRIQGLISERDSAMTFQKSALDKQTMAVNQIESLKSATGSLEADVTQLRNSEACLLDQNRSLRHALDQSNIAVKAYQRKLFFLQVKKDMHKHIVSRGVGE